MIKKSREFINGLFNKNKEKRSYEGAKIGRLFSDWVTINRGVNDEIHDSLSILRARSRDLEKNNAHAKRYFQLLRANICGSAGVSVQVKIRKRNKILDAALNQKVEKEWVKWQSSENCSVDGSLSWTEAQRFAINCIARDGELFVRTVETRAVPYGFSLEFIPPELIPEDYNREKEKGKNPIIMGIEVGEYNQPLAYYIKQKRSAASVNSGLIYNENYRRLSGQDVIHVYSKDRPFQLRGVPWLAPVMAALKQLEGMREAVLVNERVSASKMGFFVSDGELNFGVDSPEGGKVMDVEPGTFHQLPSGVSLQSFDPESNTNNFAEFENAILRSISSGLSVSYSSLSSDLGQTSYSSIRQGALEDRDHYKCLHDMFISRFVKPVFRKWISYAIKTGKVPDTLTAEEYIENTEFKGRRWSWVDPQREMSALIMGLNSGIATMQDGADYFGRDISDTFDQLSREKKLAEEKDLQTAWEPFGGGASGFGPAKIFPEAGEVEFDGANEKEIQGGKD